MSATFDISAIDDDLLAVFRSATDPIADRTIEKIIESGEKEHVNQMMMMLFRNESFEKGMFSSLGSEVSNALDEFIETTQIFPDWADPQLSLIHI